MSAVARPSALSGAVNPPPIMMHMTNTPASKQPHSMMHRALYATIVGEDALTHFAHGCTMKQYNGVDYVVDHVTRLAKPVTAFPVVPLVTEEELEEQYKYICDLREELDVIRPEVKALEKALGEVEKRESKSDLQRKASAAPSKKKTPTAQVANVVPNSENHLISLVAQLLHMGQCNKQTLKLNATHIKTLKSQAPILASYYFRWKEGILTWPKGGGPTAPPANAAPSAATTTFANAALPKQ